jgi:hypothetical protein
MMYADWEIGCIVFSGVIAVVYFVLVPRSSIGSCQMPLYSVFAAMHERDSGKVMIAVHCLRNIMTIFTVLAGASLSASVLAAKFAAGNQAIAVEMLIVTVLCAVSFINYCFCANITFYLIFNIALYPNDISAAGVEPEVIETSYEDSRRQLRLLGRHMGFGKKAMFLAVPSFFIVVHPAVLLAATIFSTLLWYYIDRMFGVQIGSVKVATLTSHEEHAQYAPQELSDADQ